MKHQTYNEQWNDSLTGDYLWNNTNFGEAITETMTPMTWSVLQFTLDDWVFLPGFSTVGNIGGQPYINISILLRVSGAGKKSPTDSLKCSKAQCTCNCQMEWIFPKSHFHAKKLFAGLSNLLRVQSKQVQGRKALVYVSGKQS